jgi:hypothetical protein
VRSRRRRRRRVKRADGGGDFESRVRNENVVPMAQELNYNIVHLGMNEENK